MEKSIFYAKGKYGVGITQILTAGDIWKSNMNRFTKSNTTDMFAQKGNFKYLYKILEIKLRKHNTSFFFKYSKYFSKFVRMQYTRKDI